MQQFTSIVFLYLVIYCHVLSHCFDGMSGVDAILDNFIYSGENDFFQNESLMIKTEPVVVKPVLAVSFVNGIYHSIDDWNRISGQLRDIFQVNEIFPFYNPSSGWWVNDLSNAGYALIRRPNDFVTAQQLAAHLRKVLETVRDNGRVLHIAHSGGAILTYLAAKFHLSAEERARIDVTTFGGGRSLTHKYFSGRIVNYYSRNDPLLLVDQRAGALAKLILNNLTTLNNSNSLNNGVIQGADCATTSTVDLDSDLCHEVFYVKHNTSFIFLKPLSNNPILDHSMEGETYLVGLRREAAAFRNRIGDLTRALEYEYAYKSKNNFTN